MDRLNARRAQRAAQEGGQSNQPAPVQQQAYEMQGVSNGNGANSAMPFYDEVDAIKSMIRQFNADVQRVSELQARLLQDVGGPNKQQNSAQLDELVEQTRETSNEIRQRIQILASQKAKDSSDARMRTDQIGQLRSRFTEAIQSYQQVEHQYRVKYRERVERQFKIVKPDATDDEVKRVIENENGGGDQIFAQALTNTNADRFREGRQGYLEVQERHQELRRIEGTLAELAQLFQDMNTLVLEQDDKINAIDVQAADVEANTQQAGQQVDKAVEHARSARKKRIICFWITLLILVIIGIIVGIVVWQETKKPNSSK